MPALDIDAASEVPAATEHDCEQDGCFAVESSEYRPQSWGAVKRQRKIDSGLDEHV